MYSLASFSLPRVCIARQEELALFDRCLQEAVTGVGSLLLLEGELGVGKTTLAAQMLQEANRQQLPLLIGRGSDLLTNTPYGLWLSAFAASNPCFHSLASLLLPRNATSASSLLTLFQQFEVLLRQVTARQAPLVVLLEYVHEADPASLDLLRLVTQGLANLPAVLLLTARSEALGRASAVSKTLAQLSRESRVFRVLVRPFDRQQVSRWLQQRYCLSSTHLLRLASYLQEYAAGNALYLEELLRRLEELGVLRQEAEDWELQDLPGEQVPPLLQHILAERFERFAPEERHLLHLAAVIGQVVPLDLWQAVILNQCCWHISNTGISRPASWETVWQVAEKGVEHALLDTLPEGKAVQFHHPLFRYVLLDTLLPARRQHWHRQVAEVLLARREPQPDAVAFHLHQARDPRAIPWLRQAAERSTKLGAALTAITLYEQMLHETYASMLSEHERAILLLSVGWMRRVTDPQSCIGPINQALQLARKIGDEELLILALACRAYLLCHNRQGQAGLSDAREVLTLWQAKKPEEREVWDLTLPNPPVSIRSTDVVGLMLYLLALCGYYQETLLLGEPLAQKLPDVSRTGSSPEGILFIGWLYTALALAYSAQGEDEKASSAFTQINEHYRSCGLWMRAWSTMQNELVWSVFPYRVDRREERLRLAARANQMVPLSGGYHQATRLDIARLPFWYLEGNWKEARQLAEWYAQSDEAFVIGKGIVKGVLGLLTFYQGDHHLTWPLIDEVLPEGAESVPGQQFFFEAQIMQRLAIMLLCEEERMELAHRWLVAYDRWLAWAGCILGQAEGRLLWACYYRCIEDREQARCYALEALRLATEVRQPLIQLGAHRLLVQLSREAYRHQEARTHLEVALVLAEVCEIPYERALTLIERAELEMMEHHLPQARATLAEARAICHDLEARPALARCSGLAQQLTTLEAAAMSSTRPERSVLTVREQEIVRLVAEGWSNQRIARHLYLSPGTVKRHLHNISQKLGACNRTQVVTLARQQGFLS
jgi:DNA-binding CsgD family transcriptional regulator